MWIQLWSPVTSANSLIASWVTSCHSETPTSSPSWALRSSNPFTVSMPASLLELGVGQDRDESAQCKDDGGDGESGDPTCAHAGVIAAIERPLDLVLAPAGDEKERDREPRVARPQDDVRDAGAADERRNHPADADGGRDRGDAGPPPGQPRALGGQAGATGGIDIGWVGHGVHCLCSV